MLLIAEEFETAMKCNEEMLSRLTGPTDIKLFKDLGKNIYDTSMQKNKTDELLVKIREKIGRDEAVDEKEVVAVSVERDGYISPSQLSTRKELVQLMCAKSHIYWKTIKKVVKMTPEHRIFHWDWVQNAAQLDKSDLLALIGAARFDDRLAIMQLTDLIVIIDQGEEKDLPSLTLCLLVLQHMVKPVSKEEDTGTYLTHETYFSLVTVLMALFDK